jgi:2-desacetyl-2-hydroxyethyl bacteriochlorophyllide A dehydrogenase
LNRQAVYFSAPRTVDVRDEPCPAPGPGEALVRTALSAISAGTEMLVYRGQAPGDMAVDESIAALGGTFGFPIKFGYAAVGRVEAVGEGVGPEWSGRLVFAFNPHESHFVARPEALQPLPVGLTPEQAVFLPNMETAVSFVMDGRPVIGEQVAVVGQGVVGLLTTALLAELPLASLVTLDAYPLRREWSVRLGATAAHAPDVSEAARRALQGERAYAGADLTYELSGDPRGLDLAIALTGYNGRVVIGSWYGRKRVELDLGGRFHRAHMRLIGSQVSALAPEWLGRWTKARRLDVAWAMIGRHAPDRLITHRLPVERAAEAYRLLDEDPAGAIQIVFTYPQP